jgi:hypothetical protein
MTTLHGYLNGFGFGVLLLFIDSASSRRVLHSVTVLIFLDLVVGMVWCIYFLRPFLSSF